MLAYPLQVCIEPIAIDVATTGGTPVLPDARFPMYDNNFISSILKLPSNKINNDMDTLLI